MQNPKFQNPLSHNENLLDIWRSSGSKQNPLVGGNIKSERDVLWSVGSFEGAESEKTSA